MKAAARTYFDKDLKDLTLAQDAILAAIPQSPTKFDLVRNAEEVCATPIKAGRRLRADEDPASSSRTRREIVQAPQLRPRPDEDRAARCRGSRHTLDEYEAAKTEPVVLAPQLGNHWRAPQFVWQVRQRARRRSSARTSRSTSATRSTPAATRSRRRSTGDAGDGREVALRGGLGAEPLQTPGRILKNLKIPQQDWGWLQNLKRQEHPQRRRRRSSTTGPARSSPTSGSASFTRPGDDEVPAPVRRPVGRLAPARLVDQADQLRDRHRGRDDDRGDAVHGRHDDFGGNFIPTQADKAERGPVRLREALQFSLNIPSIKAGPDERPRALLPAVEGLRHPLRPGLGAGRRRWASARSRSTRST